MKITKEKREALKDWLQIIAFLAAACWATYIFYYEKIYEPSHLPPFVTTNSKIEKVSEDKSDELYKVNITIQNKSKVKETILAAWFEVKGYKLIRRTIDSPKNYLDTIVKNGATSRYSDIGKNDLIDWEKILKENASLSPDQEFNVSYLFLIPKRKYEIVRINCLVVLGKKNDFKVKWGIKKNKKIGFDLIDKETKIIHASSDDIFERKPALKAFFTKYKIYYNQVTSDYAISLLDSVKSTNNAVSTKKVLTNTSPPGSGMIVR